MATCHHFRTQRHSRHPVTQHEARERGLVVLVLVPVLGMGLVLVAAVVLGLLWGQVLGLLLAWPLQQP